MTETSELAGGQPFDKSVLESAADTALLDVLDRAQAGIVAGRATAAMQRLIRSMDELVPGESSKAQDIAARCREHPLHEILLEDPFSERAYRKPNGYPGDAGMLDYLYFQTVPEETTPTGRAIFAMTTDSDTARSVRFRRALIARYIDVAASRTADAAVLSVACGHLREAGMSRAVCDAELGRFVALDQDPHSIERVSASYGRFGVEPMLGSVKELLRRGAPGEFDLVYAAGLYDYLADGTARFLTAMLFRALRPGGTLLVANFAPRHSGHGYINAFLDWTLLCRDAREMAALASGIPPERASANVFTDPLGNVVYLELERRA